MEEDGWNALGRLAAYAGLVLIPIVCLGLFVGRLLSGEADRVALDSELHHARAIIALGVEPHLDGTPLADGLSATELQRMVASAEQLRKSGQVLKLRLRDTDGFVVFDAERPGDPKGSVADRHAIEALEQGAVVERTVLGADQADGGHEEGIPAIEVYLPIIVEGSSDPIGVLEVYAPYAPVAAARNQSMNRTLGTLVWGLSIVWIALALTVWSVTRRIHHQNQRNRYLALHDNLTGLPNRALFNDRLTHAIVAGGRNGTDVAIAMVDLDRFKDVNDTLGHANGDALLRTVSDRITAALRAGDTVGRLGGDEFGIVLSDVTAADAEGILRRIGSSINTELEIGGTPIMPDACIGWAMWPQHGDDAGTLLRNADVALYAAKQVGGEAVQYRTDLPQVNPERLALISELRNAITNNELRLVYQPKYEVESGELNGFEALVRWDHPTRGQMQPAEFIPVAESTGLIGPLTRWVLSTSIRQLGVWDATSPGIRMAVNVSARNLREMDLTAWVLNELHSASLRASQLVVEITETSVASDPERATKQLAALSDAGVKLSLDDFGQGFTSLSQLVNLRVNELKIDKAFIAQMLSSAPNRAIVASVIELGHQLGLTVVAEGVEDEQALNELRLLGCDTAQGFHLARPLELHDASQLLSAYVVGNSAATA